MPLRAHAAFTLLEIMLVITLLVTVAISASLSITQMRQKRLLQTHTEQLVSTLRLAQNLSITAKDAQTHGVEFAPDSYLLVKQTATGQLLTGTRYQLPNNLSLQIQPADAQRLFFRKLTGAVDQPVTIELSTTSYQTMIKINTLGQIEATEPVKK